MNTDYVCDYIHHDAKGDEQDKPSELWTQDCDGAWTPLCGACLPEFWEGGSREDGPWVVYPIHNVPNGPKRLRERTHIAAVIEA